MSDYSKKTWRNHVPYLLRSRVIIRGQRPRRTIILLHGIGNSSSAWRETVDLVGDSNVRLVVIDLLGFGRSPQPRGVWYNTEIQARAVRLTCLLKGIATSKVTIVGHSMGALVAIEYAKRYPSHVSRLLLCSPPLYKSPGAKSVSGEAALRRIYRAIQASPQRFLKLSALVMKYELANESFNVTDANIASYMSALEAAIVNQTSLEDIGRLTLPIHIMRGRLDPLLVPGNIKRLAKDHPNITVSTVASGHEVTGLFARHVAQRIRQEAERG